MHPPYSSYIRPYSPDLSPSAYNLLLYIATDFAGEKFASREAYENRLSQFFTNRDDERGILQLPSKWPQVIEKTSPMCNTEFALLICL